MARTESTLRHLAGLTKHILCTKTTSAANGFQIPFAVQNRIQALATSGMYQCTSVLFPPSIPRDQVCVPPAGGSCSKQHVFASTSCTGVSTQQLPATPFAALTLQQTRHLMPLASLVQLSAQRLPHQVAVVQWVDDTEMDPRPRSIGSIAKYGDEDINLTRTIILTPTREADKIISPPAVTVPLKADSVRRKRKHKMNKHKHKKRKKLQRHKN